MNTLYAVSQELPVEICPVSGKVKRRCAICLRPFTDGHGDLCADCWDHIPEVGDRRLVHITPAVWSPAPQHRWILTPEEWAAYPIERIDSWRSQFGALEFYEMRMAHGVEAYTPLPRPLDRYIDWLFFRPLNRFIPVEVLVRVEPRFGAHCPLHIGAPFADDYRFLEKFLKSVQDNKRAWQHEHSDYGAKQAGSYPTYERKLWWMQGYLIGDSPEGEVTKPINEIESILASVRQSWRFISRPLRTCCTENNVAVPVHFDVIPIVEPKPFAVEPAAIVIPEKDQTVIRPEDFIRMVGIERQRQKIENLRDYEPDRQEWTPELETEWENKLKEEADKLLTRARLQTPCGECKECLEANGNHTSAFETCVCISRYSSGFYGKNPGYVPGSGVTYFDPSEQKTTELSEQWDSPSHEGAQSSSDDSGDSLWVKNLNDGADYIDHGNQTEKGATAEWIPVVPSMLNREERKIFNPEGAPRSPEMIAEIKSHPLYSNEERAYYMKMTGTPLNANGKPNTIIKRFIRHEEKRDEYLSVADSGEPEFLFAFRKFLCENKSSQAGWYVALCLNNRWMLYRLELSFDETFPLGAAVPNVEMQAFMKLWLHKHAQAEQSAKRKGHDVQIASQQVDEAFDRVKAIHYLPAVREPKKTSQ